MANLEHFIHHPDMDYDPLVKMAIAHYQFEAIHPFSDGNGRTGRILNVLYLVEQQLLDWPILYLSRFIIENKTAYYEGLRAVTNNGEWERWILYMLYGVKMSALQSITKIDKILHLMTDVKALIREKAPKIYSQELVDILFAHPYCKIRFIEQAGIAKRQTAGSYLNTLSDLGILMPIFLGREKYYLNKQLIDVLSE